MAAQKKRFRSRRPTLDALLAAERRASAYAQEIIAAALQRPKGKGV